MRGWMRGCLSFGLRGLENFDPRPGGPLEKSDLAEINRSNCKQLRDQLTGYELNADSTEWGVDGVRAIVARSKELGCRPALRSAYAKERLNRYADGGLGRRPSMSMSSRRLDCARQSLFGSMRHMSPS